MDYGLIDGAAFLAMEFVDGVDALRAVTLSGDERVMPEGIALHVISEVAHALAYIHDVKDEHGEPLGIVHRDVSPQNILLSWDGDVKLSDFGIALCMQREEQTAEGVVKGKLPYMAPEQALGERVNAAADVYALGATLATLLGGRAMGPAMTDEEAWARVVEARERGVSAAVAELIGACTCRSPGDRLRAADVAAAAGSLAFQKLSRGARATLRDWLSPLKPRDQEGSALDDLMGLCLVPVAGRRRRAPVHRQPDDADQPDGVRTEAPPSDTRRTLRTLRALPDPRAARTSAPIEIQDYLPLPLTTGQKVARAARWAATAIVVAAAATFTAWKSGVAVHSASAARRAAAPAAGGDRTCGRGTRRRRAHEAAPSAADEPPMIFHRTPPAPPSPTPKRRASSAAAQLGAGAQHPISLRKRHAASTRRPTPPTSRAAGCASAAPASSAAA